MNHRWPQPQFQAASHDPPTRQPANQECKDSDFHMLFRFGFISDF
jgi:hypothetical protein